MELPGHEPYCLLMKNTSLKKHKRAQSTGVIKGKYLLCFSEIVFEIFPEYEIGCIDFSFLEFYLILNFYNMNAEQMRRFIRQMLSLACLSLCTF